MPSPQLATSSPPAAAAPCSDWRRGDGGMRRLVRRSRGRTCRGPPGATVGWVVGCWVAARSCCAPPLLLPPRRLCGTTGCHHGMTALASGQAFGGAARFAAGEDRHSDPTRQPLGHLADRRAGAHEVAVAGGGVVPSDRRPPLGGAQGRDRERATTQLAGPGVGPPQDGRHPSSGPAWRCARRWRSGMRARRPGRHLVSGCGVDAELAARRSCRRTAAGLPCSAWAGLLGRCRSCPARPPCNPADDRAARPHQQPPRAPPDVADPPGCGRSRPLAPVWAPACAGRPRCLGRLTRAGTRAAPPPSHSNATGGNMAALFLVLAVVDAVLLGDAVLANTSASSVSVFDQSITGFTQGQLLLVAAGLGLLGALLLGLAWRSSGARRAKRRQLRAARRDLESKVAELERDNATLRQERERLGRLAELREASSQAQQARERASQPPVDAHA